MERFDGFGNRQEEVRFHPAYKMAGNLIYGSGVMEEFYKGIHDLKAMVKSMALFYLSSLNGEAGHNCPLACTAGIIKILEVVAPLELKDRYLPSLLDSDYETLFHGAQFLTEIQGGSDVGANQCEAEKIGDHYEINGEKWFCSNCSAQLFLMTAKIKGSLSTGTKSLGLFLVPRNLSDGELNGFHIRRLKDKLGTRGMASGEIDFKDCKAWLIGEEGKGFNLMASHVLNTSRIFNAFAACGNAKRAFITALSYAKTRGAFGHKIENFPLVQRTLLQIAMGSQGILSGSFKLLQILYSKNDGSLETEQARRFLINANKVRSAQISHKCVHLGIEILGGNGAIESFSILPRLLRDNIVMENWEGTHNTLSVQFLRDLTKVNFSENLMAIFDDLAEKNCKDAGPWLEKNQQFLNDLINLRKSGCSLEARDLLESLMDHFYALSLISDKGISSEKKVLIEELGGISLEGFKDSKKIKTALGL